MLASLASLVKQTLFRASVLLRYLCVGTFIASLPVQTCRADAAPQTIFVASNGWHSAIFVLRSAITEKNLPEIDDFSGALYIGFGWGDADYFPARDPGFTTLLSAALVPTPSVIHVTGLRVSPRDAYPRDQVVALTLSHDGFGKLVRYIADTFDRRRSRRAETIAPGLDPNSRFYRARGEFHLFNTCNSWTARGLAAAGFAIDPDGLVRAEDLMAEVRALNRP